jgi:hypothetical protein
MRNKLLRFCAQPSQILERDHTRQFRRLHCLGEQAQFPKSARTCSPPAPKSRNKIDGLKLPSNRNLQRTLTSGSCLGPSFSSSSSKFCSGCGTHFSFGLGRFRLGFGPPCLLSGCNCQSSSLTHLALNFPRLSCNPRRVKRCGKLALQFFDFVNEVGSFSQLVRCKR